ncbi:hypothetical protein [Xanthomonas citri]|uniref:hypothetical protein n=1 Tax=Xanthomonas citri TaxID=346 RepID=UPI0005B855BF|nr:hypothetical protein [Xanthomonas citri]
MLPPKLTNFLRKVVAKTNAGEIDWVFDDFRTAVSVQGASFSLDVRYHFNEVKGVGEFSIFYSSGENDQEHPFYVDQYAEDDYHLMQVLFNAAQGAAASFPF